MQSAETTITAEIKSNLFLVAAGLVSSRVFHPLAWFQTRIIWNNPGLKSRQKREKTKFRVFHSLARFQTEIIPNNSGLKSRQEVENTWTYRTGCDDNKRWALYPGRRPKIHFEFLTNRGSRNLHTLGYIYSIAETRQEHKVTWAYCELDLLFRRTEYCKSTY